MKPTSARTRLTSPSVFEPAFAAFLAKHAELGDARLINAYYSADALMSDAAATEFALADKKPLPNPVRPA